MKKFFTDRYHKREEIKKENVEGIKIISDIPADIAFAAIAHDKGEETEVRIQVKGNTAELLRLYEEMTKTLAEVLYNDLKEEVEEKVSVSCDEVAKRAALGLSEFTTNKISSKNN